MILLPYIRNNINKTKFIIFTERDLSSSIKVVLDKCNFEKKEKDEIFKLNWTNKKIEKFLEYNFDNHTIIINGSNKYISNINKKIKNYEKDNIEIVDCYNISEEGLKVEELQKKYQGILNTKNANL